MPKGRPRKLYRSRRGKHHAIVMHREILGLKEGDPRVGDHINPQLTLDNRRENLRIADSCQSAWNKPINIANTSGLKGASFSSKMGKWKAQISVRRKVYALGYFDTKEEAHAAYCKAAIERHGEFARIA